MTKCNTEKYIDIIFCLIWYDEKDFGGENATCAMEQEVKTRRLY